MVAGDKQCVFITSPCADLTCCISSCILASLPQGFLSGLLLLSPRRHLRNACRCFLWLSHAWTHVADTALASGKLNRTFALKNLLCEWIEEPLVVSIVLCWLVVRKLNRRQISLSVLFLYLRVCTLKRKTAYALVCAALEGCCFLKTWQRPPPVQSYLNERTVDHLS